MAACIILFVVLALSWGCTGSENEKPVLVETDKPVRESKLVFPHDTGICSEVCGSLGWVGGSEREGEVLFKGKRKIPAVELGHYVLELNQKWEAREVTRGLALGNLRMSNDTLLVDIENAHIFTQQMGSTGAMMTKAVIVYSLTEDPKVRHVALLYEEGDHGGPPGVFEREDVDDDLSIVDDPECACREER